MNWPIGPLLPEEIESLKNKSYDDMKLDEKLAWISYLFSLIEVPNEDNTTMKNADVKVEAAFADADKAFEMMWFLAKENPLLRASCQIFKKYYDKIAKIRKFKWKIDKMRKPQRKFIKRY